KRKPIVIPGKSFLPLKVIARPFSNIYKEPDENSPIVEENVPVFQPYFVYTKPKTSITSTQPTGWYEVGSDNRGTILGWMKANDVMEWKQAMCLAYQHPLGRKPVLMFKDIKPLQELVNLPEEERKKKVEGYYKAIESKQIPDNFPIVAMEPEGAIDITKHFYLLPILESAEVQIEGREARLIKMASAPKSGRGKTELTATHTQNVKQSESNTSIQKADSNETSPVNLANNATVHSDNMTADLNLEKGIVLDEEARKKVAMDIVFVVDMTQSMQPYIDATTEAIKSMVEKISKDPVISQKIRFGLWGYRDSLDIPGMEFVTKNFTPELQEVKTFVNTLSKVKAAKFSSQGYPEDVFSGVDDAMRKTAWRKNAIRIVVLIGDAPSHPPGHKWNLSGQSAETLRTFANDNKIYIAAFHIVNPQAGKYNEVAEMQFRTLARNPGDKSGYKAIPANNIALFTTATRELADSLTNLIKQASLGVVRIPYAQSGHGSQNAKNIGMNIGYAALVEWLGSHKGLETPRDIIAWVIDKDLLDPAISSLDVRILINKKNLDSLKKTLSDILAAGRRGIISGESFFDALLAVASAGSRDPDQIRNAKTLAETGLLPEFLQGLPYKSQIMEMNNEIWSSMSVAQQEEFLNGLEAKIQLYVAIHDAPEGWVALNPSADPDEYVYPLSLAALP
ncbi:MAG: VWA domain-containing protein, partial [Chlorobi bacterium]|nr:VWA domain-containing protein [Chlorobiota bacterium]